MVKHRQLHVLIILITVLLLSALVVPNTRTRAEDSMLWYHGGAVIVEEHSFGNITVYVSYPNNEVLDSYRNAYLVTFDLDKYTYKPFSPSLSVEEIVKKVNITIQNLRKLGVRVRGFDTNITIVVSGVTLYKPPIIYIELVNHAKGLHISVPNLTKIRLIIETIENVFQDSNGIVVVCDSILFNISRYYTSELWTRIGSIIEESIKEGKLQVAQIYRLDRNASSLGSKFIVFIIGRGFIVVPCGIPAVASFDLVNTRWDELPDDAKMWVIERFREYIDFIRRYIPEHIPLYVYVINQHPLIIAYVGRDNEAVNTAINISIATVNTVTEKLTTSEPQNTTETLYRQQIAVIAIAMVGALILALHTDVRRSKS